MRTTNIKKTELPEDTATAKIPRDVKIRDEGDRAPCFFAEVEKAEKAKDWKWKVGCKFEGQVEECSFKFGKVGDVDDANVWQRLNSIGFVTELLEVFKDGGEEAVKEWVKNGCP